MSSEVNEGSSAWFEFLGWVETNKKNLLYALIGVVVLSFLVAAYRWKTRETELAASEALLALRVTAPVGSTQTVASPTDFQKVVSGYSGTAAAERAALLAAGALFTDGKYAEAQSAFSKFLQDHGHGGLAGSAAYGVAASLEAQGKKDEALTAYQNVQTRFGSSAVADDSQLAAARILEAKGQAEAALKIYDDLSKPAANGARPANSQASQFKQDLLTLHPELAKTNATPTGASVAPAPPSAPK